MKQIKPNWSIAQQISRRHTLVSFGISIPFFLSVIILAIVGLKICGVPNSGLFLRNFVAQHQSTVYTTALLIHFIPINFYAIIQVFKTTYPKFDLKIISKEQVT